MTNEQTEREQLKAKVKEKLTSAADDLRRAAAQGHRHAGHLHEEAEVIENVARQSEAALDEDSAPVGKSGEGITSRSPPASRPPSSDR